MLELRSVELFREIGSRELDDLRAISREMHFAAGVPIFQEGDPGDGFYVIRSGSVQIAHIDGSQMRHVFSALEPGAVFGEMAVIEQEPRSATALAVGDTHVWFFPRDPARRLLQNCPGLAFNLLQMASQRLREFNRRHLQELVQAESLAVIGRFAQGIVHDLKNPLSIISLSAELFELPGADNPDFRAKTQMRIKKQVDRINNLVSDILIFTESRRRQTPLPPSDYRGFVEELLPDLKAEAELKAARLEWQGNCPAAKIRFDPRRLSRVFYNLTHNATEVMLNGGSIFLRSHLDGPEVITEVEDTGPGIPPEMAGQLFQPFATHGKSRGTGLGLAICRKIIEDHDGRIWAGSKPGRGAIFCFALPLAK